MHGIEILNKYGVRFSANMVVSQANAEQVYETGKLAHDLGARFFAATKASPPLGCADYSSIRPSEEQIRKSLDDLLRLEAEVGIPVDILECYPLCFFGDVAKYEKFAKRSCSAGVSSATIGSDGSVRPCSHSNRIYGNILEEGLSAIYHKMTEWRSGDLLPQKCLECSHFKRCTGGCRCEAEYYGEVTDMDPLAYGPEQVTLPPKTPKAEVDVYSGRLTSARNIRIRREEFGVVVRLGRQTILLDSEGSELIKLLHSKECSFSEILSTLSCDEVSCRKLTEKLVREGFVIQT
jgi:radical SAM protein with 4Fe4S-binding SPASM domain